VHISKLGRGKRIAKVEDVVKLGDKLRVEIADIDNRGKISLVLVAEDEAAEAPDTSNGVLTDSGAAPADAATASN
ncbi:MAG: polyribonucleotide nucleotidyltransferase, partial [Mycobacterium sp.]|nr:polyribonucleotide nucleotidyltransferase [Mycobacterium sp.]